MGVGNMGLYEIGGSYRGPLRILFKGLQSFTKGALARADDVRNFDYSLYPSTSKVPLIGFQTPVV